MEPPTAEIQSILQKSVCTSYFFGH